jgi:hypothetical protein
MVEENFALSLAAPKVKQSPTLPFPKDEMEKILKATESDKVDKRVKTFILTMRYAGLRISCHARRRQFEGQPAEVVPGKDRRACQRFVAAAHCRCFAFREAGESEIFFLERHFKTYLFSV